MRTLDELLDIAKAAETEYKSKKQESEKEYQSALDAKEQAHARAETALSHGDSASYAESSQEEKFQNEKALLLYKRTAFPHFSKAEYNALIDETNAACTAEQRPYYRRMAELAAEWNDLVKQINKIAGKASAVEQHLRHTGIPDRGIALTDWHNVSGHGVHSALESVFAPGSSVYLYIPRKEKKTNE